MKFFILTLRERKHIQKYRVCFNARYVYSLIQEEAWQKHYLENGPVALTLHSNVSVSVGGTVQLPCRIKNLGEYTVII